MNSDRIIQTTMPHACPTCKAQPGDRCNVRRGDRVAHFTRQDRYRRSVFRIRRNGPWGATPEERRYYGGRA